LSKLNIVTDFVYGKAIYKLPISYKKKLSKICNIFNINQKKLPKKDIDIYWGTRIKDSDLIKFPNLKWIHFGSVGTDKLSYNLLKNKKVKITNSKKINSWSVANLILLFFLDINKRLFFLKRFSNRKNYEDIFTKITTDENEKVLILGYGNVAKITEKLLKNFTKYIDIYSSRSKHLKKKNLISFKSCKKKLKQYSVVINLLPNNQNNNEFINFKFLKRLKQNTNLILIGRIETININDLFSFAFKNKNSCIYLDGSIRPKLNRKFKKLNNVFITPHIGGYYYNYWTDQYKIFSENLKKFINRSRLKNLVKISKLNFK
tara:strand:+ start:6096 stop:7049 length:954 start_codon:yes stop_codon:yes gene_type:complete